jgi:hypothetical protein
MTPILYAKIGGAVALAALLVWTGWHFGGMSSAEKLAKYQTAVEAQYAANLKTVADTLNKQIQDGLADRAAQQRIIDAYDLEKALPPATAGIVERMRFVESASCAASRELPKAGTMAGGADPSGRVPGSQAEADRLLQAALDAADRDADRLDAIRQLAPKP